MPRGVRAGLAALVLVAGAPVPAAGQGPHTSDPAQQKARVDRERNRLADRYDETQAAEADQLAAYEQSRAVAAELARKLVVLQRYVGAVQQDLERAAANAARAVLHQDALREDLRAARVELDRRRSELRGMAVSGYVWFGERGSVQNVYGQSLTAQQQLVSRFYAGYLDDLERDRVHAVELQQTRVMHLSDNADRARDKAEAARQEVAKRRDELQKARDEQAAAKHAADVEVEHQGRLVAEVEAKRSDYERQLDELAAESDALGVLLRAHQAATAARTVAPQPARKPRSPAAVTSPPPARPPSRPTTTTTGTVTPPSPTTTPRQTSTTNNAGVGPPPHIAVHLNYPLPGYPVVSGYGWRIHPILGVRKLHEGIDIAAPMGTPIHAAAAGVVIWAGPRNGYGNAVIIDHGSGVGTVYAHQSVIASKVGQTVASGQVIGYVGQTGLAASPHLHFEVRVGGRTYDPLAYVHPS